jgi:hypothetical protein
MRFHNVLRRNIFVAVLASGWPLPAGAETSEQRTEARAHYDLATKLVRAKDFDRAADEFRKAYEILPRFDVLYNLGQAYVVLQRRADAVDALSRYLLYGGELIPVTRRVEVEQEIDRLNLELAATTLGRNPPENTSLPPPSAREAPTSAIVPRTDRPAQKLASVPPPRPVSRTAVPPDRPGPPARRIVGYGLAGGGVALGIVATIVYIDNIGRFTDWRRRQRALDREWEAAVGTPAAVGVNAAQTKNNELGRSIEARDRTAAILAIVGGGLLAGGVTLTLITASSEPDARVVVDVEVRASSIGVTGRF